MKYQKPGIAFLCVLAFLIVLAAVDHVVGKETNEVEQEYVQSNDEIDSVVLLQLIEE